MSYTGRKLNKYTWIPKSKTDLREYREVLKICHTIENENGYFSDKSLGKKMVELRAIVDRDNSAKSYVKKYDDKKIADQSYVSNARMLIRIFRWLGFVSKDYDSNENGKFYLTPEGEELLHFTGPYPAIIGEQNEMIKFQEAFASMRYHSVNDDTRYRNYYFRQRVFFNLIRFLKIFDYATHYELALSALVLKDESKNEIKSKRDKILECRSGGKNIRWLMEIYEMNCENKSTVTGIYDGPKVLLSFARQLGLVAEINLKDCDKNIIKMYKKMYKNSGVISEKSIKKINQITPLGEQFVNEYKNKNLLWYENLPSDKNLFSTFLILSKKGIEKSVASTLKINLKKIEHLFEENSGKLFLKKDVDFNLYRDIPYENRKQVIETIKSINPNFFKQKEKEIVMQKIFNPNEYPLKRCIDCHQGSCAYYRENMDALGGKDRFPTRVCPENLLTYNMDGELEINSNDCVGCGLCLINCNFDGLSINENNQVIKNKNTTDECLEVTIDDKEKITKKLEEKYLNHTISSLPPKIKKQDMPSLVKNFISKIDKPGKKWDKDKCYTYVRNVFKLFDVNAIYSGSGGMKTRSDVTIESPFIAVSEVKSPAESPINLKAVRQAFHAAIQAKTQLTMAIGLETHKGAIEEEEKFKEATGIGILLLEIKYLALLVYLNQFIQYTPDSLLRLIKNFGNHFKPENFIDYLNNEIKLCKNKITTEEIKKIVTDSFQ